MDTIDNFNKILNSFNIKATCLNSNQIDNYSYYDLKLLSQGKVNDIKKYLNEFSLLLKTPNKPNMKILHSEGIIRLEFVKDRTDMLKLFDIFSNKNIPKGNIMCLLGQTLNASPLWMDLSQNPHLIISGATGSGKSTLLHNIIANLFNYNNVDLFLVDPKRIEFSLYEYKKNIKVFHTYDETLDLINGALELMEIRYDFIKRNPNLKLKPIVIMIDEFSDLILQDKEEKFYLSLCKLAQKCRAASIHIVLSTQRPSVNFINGSIKANFPARVACRVASHIDSRVILDATGAEHLLGKGDALIRDNTRFLERFQIAYTTPQEVSQYFLND